MEDQLAETQGDERVALENRIATLRRHIGALAEITPTPPQRTLTDSLTLQSGSRTIEIIHLGRAHTGGDVVVYLPAEKVVFAGDLFYDASPYLGDGFPLEFVDALERLKEIDADIFFGGHGGVTTDRARITARQDYIRDYWAQVKQAYDEGIAVEDVPERLDLASHGFGVRPIPQGNELRRMYHLLDGGE